jgi:nucleotide-binding universal stress UspA family protein
VEGGIPFSALTANAISQDGDALLPFMAIDDHDPDLVVMGTHGHSGIRRRLLGSVTERIVRDAPVPVLTVKSDTEASGSPA